MTLLRCANLCDVYDAELNQDAQEHQTPSADDERPRFKYIREKTDDGLAAMKQAVKRYIDTSSKTLDSLNREGERSRE